MFDRRMVVHVVAAEIGERCSRKPHAIKAMLVETMGRGLHRGMGDTGARKRIQ